MLHALALTFLLACPNAAAQTGSEQALPGAPSSTRPAESPLQASARRARVKLAGSGDGRPTELHEVVRVVDGDTLHVRRGETLEKLRFLSVDTEEKIRGRGNSSGSKPQTVFGTETSAWADHFFTERADADGVIRVGLLFPDGIEARDVYGRLLCHVIMPDGLDFNLLLVELGKSPYFNKYGNSRICHEQFVLAESAARAGQLGVWNPATNEPKTPGAPSAKRPYDQLLPWWHARADAIDAYRELRAKDPGGSAAADVPEELEAAAATCAKKRGREVRVFGSIDRIFDETDGGRTLLFRTGRDLPALRVRIPREKLAAFAALDLESSREEFRQNYLWVTGALASGKTSRGGYEITVSRPEQISRAGPEPVRAGTSTETESR